ncbi:MAG: hypothetical protein ABSF28_05395 [Terracidiphilus sp.]|jgi:uncharacterized membrane protein YphA (DoxX/SURF4 family)
MRGSSFWLNCFAAILFAVGAFLTVSKSAKRTGALDRAIAFGPFFFGWPLAVFGAQHIVFLKDVVNGVPAWMPGHLFWALLVGIALIAAALSLTTGIMADRAALMTGVMLFCFVLMIYVPNLVENPGDLAVTQLLRDLSMSGGALALAGTLAKKGKWSRFGWIATVGRYFFAVGIVDFGVENFVHPEYAPVVPEPGLMMPAWIPAHMAYAWFTGAILVLCGVAMIVSLRTRLAGVVAGIAFFALVVFFYLPMEVVHPSIEISGELDQLAQALAMSGAALLVAGAEKADYR